MTATLLAPHAARPARPRRSARWQVVIALVLAVAVIAATLWWYCAGATLDLSSGGISASSTPGKTINVGFFPRTSDGAVTIDRVQVRSQPGLTIRFVGVDAPVGVGVGLTQGPVRHVVPLAGWRLASDLRDSRRQRFEIVMRVTARRPGSYFVDGVTVGYHSGLRSRTVDADGSSLCLTVAGPGVTLPRESERFVAHCGRS